VENWTLDNAHAKNQKVSVLTGPVFQQTDKVLAAESGDQVQIPNDLWKVVVMLNGHDDLSATVYLLTQEELIFDMMETISKAPTMHGLFVGRSRTNLQTSRAALTRELRLPAVSEPLISHTPV